MKLKEQLRSKTTRGNSKRKIHSRITRKLKEHLRKSEKLKWESRNIKEVSNLFMFFVSPCEGKLMERIKKLKDTTGKTERQIQGNEGH